MALSKLREGRRVTEEKVLASLEKRGLVERHGTTVISVKLDEGDNA